MAGLEEGVVDVGRVRFREIELELAVQLEHPCERGIRKSIVRKNSGLRPVLSAQFELVEIPDNHMNLEQPHGQLAVLNDIPFEIEIFVQLYVHQAIVIAAVVVALWSW